MSSMRGIDTPVRQRRRRVFKEVANLAYNSKNLKDDMEALPYKIVDYEESEFWESVYRDRAIIRERIRLAMGMSLRPENREHPGHLTQGLEESNIDEKYYEPLSDAGHSFGMQCLPGEPLRGDQLLYGMSGASLSECLSQGRDLYEKRQVCY